MDNQELAGFDADALRDEIVRLRSLLVQAGIDAERAQADAALSVLGHADAFAARHANTRKAEEQAGSAAEAAQGRYDLVEAHRDELQALNDWLGQIGAALSLSEARYRAILDSSTDYAIIATDLDGVITTWNEGARQILGWPEEELLGTRADIIFTPEDREQRRPQTEMSLTLRDGRASDERWHMRKDGRRFWAAGLLMPLKVDGEVRGFLKILRDRTQEREAEEHRRRIEERLELALGAAVMVGIWDWEFATDLIYADANFASIYGIDPELAGRGVPLADYTHRFHPDDLPGFELALKKTLEDGTPFSHEYRVLQADGSFRWLLARGNVVRDADGTPVRFPGASIDITDRKLAEDRQAALVELSDRFRDVEDTAEITAITAQVLGRVLRLTRGGYGSVDPTGSFVEVDRDWTASDVQSIAGRHRFADYGSFNEDLRKGRTVVIDDVEEDPRTSSDLPRLRRLGIRALFNVPVMEHGRLVGILFLHDNKVRHWSRAKVDFVRDVAQRTRDAVERLRAEDHQRLLANELQHRVKNTLAMIQAIAAQTFKDAATPEAQSAFANRVVALAHANDVLTKAGWTAAPVEDVVTGATIPHCAGPERFTLSGPAIEIAARAALAMTLALHELCTNASKYGALSVEGGHVTIEWEIDAEANFQLRWRERGGPAVAVPTRKGFGTRLLERSLGAQLGGSVNIDYAPEGVTCLFQVPLVAVQDVVGAA